MKKILALVLIMALMAAAAGSACAETLDFEAGTPSKVTPEEFKTYFTILEEDSGYNFIWEDDIGTDNAYSVYKGASEDGMMTMNIYAADGGVVYAEGVGNLVIDTILRASSSPNAITSAAGGITMWSMSEIFR